MRHPMEFLQFIPRQQITRTDSANSERPASATLPRTLEVPSTQVYDAVDRRLMDTFPASDAVGRY